MINFILISSAIMLSLYLMIVLISFDPSDPSWLQTGWNGSIHNIGGVIGARLSDFLFFIFGILAYIIPLFILLYLWRIYIKKIHFPILITLVELIGLLILLCVCCSILNYYLIIDNFFYFSSGGIIGCILCDWISSYKSSFYDINLIFFIIGIFGVILFYNKFFVTIIKIIGKQLFNNLNIFKKKFFKKYKAQNKHTYNHLYYGRSHIYSFVVFKNLYNCFKNAQKKSFKKKLSPNISLNTNCFSEKFNFNLKEKDDFVTCIDASNVSKKNNNLLEKYQIKYPNIYLHHIDYNDNRKNYIKKYNKKLCRDDKLCVLKDRNDKRNVGLLQKDYNLMHTINNSNVMRRPISIIKKYTNQHVSNLKDIDTSIMHCNLHRNAKNIIFPDINLLIESGTENKLNTVELKNISQLLEQKLAEYRILINVVNVISGPVITRFELSLLPGMKSSKIVSLSRDLARSLSVASVKVIEIIPGTPYVGLEIPNKNRRIVRLRDIINSDHFKKINTPLALVLGKDISGNPIVADLRSMPHLLVAGTTGSGKSVGINAMIISILYKAKPDEVRFVMIDPKILELSIYSGIPHILERVITDIQDTEKILQWCIQEMDRRYQLMAMIGVRNLESYNCYIEQLYSEKCVINDFANKFINSTIINHEKKLKKLPYIVIIIDEFSDLIITSAKKIEELIIRLTQKARAAGIHLILATQRPSVNVITGLIKANIPARIAFTVSSKIDSHTIIGQSGAESLLGMGDMLYLAPNSFIPIRVHGACIQDKEIHAVVNFWKIK